MPQLGTQVSDSKLCSPTSSQSPGWAFMQADTDLPVDPCVGARMPVHREAVNQLPPVGGLGFPPETAYLDCSLDFVFLGFFQKGES